LTDRAVKADKITSDSKKGTGRFDASGNSAQGSHSSKDSAQQPQSPVDLSRLSDDRSLGVTVATHKRQTSYDGDNAERKRSRSVSRSFQSEISTTTVAWGVGPEASVPIANSSVQIIQSAFSDGLKMPFAVHIKV